MIYLTYLLRKEYFDSTNSYTLRAKVESVYAPEKQIAIVRNSDKFGLLDYTIQRDLQVV